MDKKTVQFMDRCKPKCGFSLSAVYSHFVASQIDSDVVNEIIRVNSTDMPCTMIVNIRSFVDFLFNLKASIEKILGDGFIVEVYNSLDLWRNAFKLCEHRNLKKLQRIDQSIAVTVRYAGDFTCQDEHYIIFMMVTCAKYLFNGFVCGKKITRG